MAEIEEVIESGERLPARHGRMKFRKNFPFDADWQGKHYPAKQVEVIAVEAGAVWVVVTVIVRYLGG